jgi:hypothetical protein
MRQKSVARKSPAERVVREFRRKTRKRYGSEEKIRIVLEGLRGEDINFWQCVMTITAINTPILHNATHAVILLVV